MSSPVGHDIKKWIISIRSQKQNAIGRGTRRRQRKGAVAGVSGKERRITCDRGGRRQVQSGTRPARNQVCWDMRRSRRETLIHTAHGHADMKGTTALCQAHMLRAFIDSQNRTRNLLTWPGDTIGSGAQPGCGYRTHDVRRETMHTSNAWIQGVASPYVVF